MPALKITLKRSLIGFERSQGLTARALGLGKIGSSVVQPDNAAVRGMIGKIEHVVVFEEVEGDHTSETQKRGKPADPAPRVKRRRPRPTHAPRKA